MHLLLDLLDAADEDTVGTSVRLPVALRDAAAVATGMGLATSTTELTVQGLRAVLEAAAQRAVLDAHHRRHPGARPDLAEIALAAAAIDGHPLADRPDLVRQAAAGVRSVTDDPTPRRRPGLCRQPGRGGGMTRARTVVLDNEAVQALIDPGHRKHRRALAIVEAGVARNRRAAGTIRMVVPPGPRARGSAQTVPPRPRERPTAAMVARW